MDLRGKPGNDEPAQRLAGKGNEHAGLGIGRLAARAELLNPHAEGLAHLLAGEERRLVEQRHAAPRAAKVIVMVQELLPLRPSGRSGVDAQGRSFPAIGEQRLDVAGDGVADARKVAAISGRFLVSDAEIAILLEDVEET